MNLHLHGELSSWRDDDTLRSLNHFPSVVLGIALNEFVEDWQEESCSFTRSSLGAGHEIPPSQDDGKATLLHWSGNSVARLLDVFL